MPVDVDAFIGIRMGSAKQGRWVHERAKKIGKLEKVRPEVDKVMAEVVSGRFDIMVHVKIKEKGLKGLTDFIYDILKVGDIKGTETFIVLPDPGP